MPFHRCIFLLAALPILFLGSPARLTTGLRAADDTTSADEALLTKLGIKTDGPGLLDFFRKRSLGDDDRKRLQLLVRQLGDRSYRKRRQAQADLIATGTPALPFLKAAERDPDPEVAVRVKECLALVEKGPGTMLPAAAARLLVKRRPAGAVAALLLYVPYIEDQWLEEEIFASLGSLALNNGQVDPLLINALKDPVGSRRGAAAFILGRWAGPDHRAAVRRLLSDEASEVRRYAAQGLIGKETHQVGVEENPSDRDLLKDQKVPADTAGLLAFLRKRSLTDADRRRLQDLVLQLEDRALSKRMQATEALIAAGTPALPFLRLALKNPDIEVVKRVEFCKVTIETGPGTALAISAVRLLVARAPAEAVKTLVTYVPSADDDFVEEAVLEGLSSLSAREEKLDPALVAALEDPMPARRAAAAYVLGRVGARAHCDAVRQRLRDPDDKTRLRAAQGLLFAKDKAGLPLLLKLQGESAAELAALAEGVLRQVAGEDAPDASALEGSPEQKKKARDAWQAWFRDKAARADLANLLQQTAERGLTVICEFDGTRMGKGTVWEFGRDFKPRWKIDGLEGPMDAHMLSDDRVLIAEYYSMKITERDTRGDVKWQHPVTGNPIACGRMRNGNIFIATYTNLIEVTRDHKEIHNYNRAADGQIYSAQKLPNGHIVYMTSLGNVVEMDGATGKVIHKFNVGYPGAWCGVEWLPGGRYLICLMATGKVMEVDSRGTPSWTMTVTGAHQTLRLRNGRIMIVCMNNKKLVEVDRASKKEIYNKPMEGRPWRVHRR